jgi:hypothetical protein
MPNENHEIEYKDCELELKVASGDGPGILEGYAAAFGNVDRANEVIMPGAFARSLEDFKASGFLCNGHNWKEELGTIVDAKEDDRSTGTPTPRREAGARPAPGYEHRLSGEVR